MKWYPFDEARGYRQKRPPVKRPVLVLVKTSENLPNIIAMGYRKNGAGDKRCPYFVIPGLGGKVLAWSDCLKLDDSRPFEIWQDSGEALKAREETKNG